LSEGALGVHAVADMAAGSSDEARLRMWVRAGLNEGCLGARLLALWLSRELYEQWYDRYSSGRFETWSANACQLSA